MGNDIEDDDERIPTYEESITQSSGARNTDSKSANSTPQQSRAPLSYSLANVRTDRINSIISTYIDPLLEAQALSGLHKTVIALVPSNSASLQTSTASQSDIIEGSGDSIAQNTTEAVIGFPDEDYVKVVRLHGDEYTMEFWRQPAVINELESAMKSRLAASGHDIYDESTASLQVSNNAATQSRSMPPIAKRGLFRKKLQEAPPPPPVEQAAPSTPHVGQVKLKIGLQEISLRVVTEMGLYDTKTGKALVIDMEIG